MAFLMRKSAQEVSNRIISNIIIEFNDIIIQEYKLCARLKGTAGPINCLAFAHDGKFLASGSM
jgi:hypothetical protein